MTDLSFAALRPEYYNLWQRVNAPGGVTRLDEVRKQAQAIMEPNARLAFDTVEKMTGVPWFITGIISTRESGSPPNFTAWLHNGDPMFDHFGNHRQTTHVPAHRPPNPACSWEDGCVDAYTLDGVMHKKDWSPAFVAWLLERFNGFGYRLYHHIPSPYLWGGTIVQERGKYTRDEHFDSNVMDEQIGGLALLVALMQMDQTAKFETGTEAKTV